MNPFKVLVEILTDFDQQWAIALAERRQEISCHKGCSACCDEPLYVTKAETKLLIRTLPVEELPGVVERTKKWLDNAQVSGILESTKPNVIEYKGLNLPCPFLKDRLCLVYKVRPYACRAHCAIGPATDCTTNRINQLYANLGPSLLFETYSAIHDISPEYDHLGVWLARFYLRVSIRSAAFVSEGFVVEQLLREYGSNPNVITDAIIKAH